MILYVERAIKVADDRTKIAREFLQDFTRGLIHRFLARQPDDGLTAWNRCYILARWIGL